MAKDEIERARVLMQFKNQPAQIVCLAEAEKLVAETLEATPDEAAGVGASSSSAVADVDKLVARPSFEYLVLRGPSNTPS